MRAEPGPLPDDTRINVRYGGNHEGEPYQLGQDKPGQSVFCSEQVSHGGASGVTDDGASDDGASGGGGGEQQREEPAADDHVDVLKCRLFTQGPARLDAAASGYEPVVDQALALQGNDRCEVPIEVVLIPSPPDAEMD